MLHAIKHKTVNQTNENENNCCSNPIYPTPPLGQDMTQGQFLSGV